MWHFMDVKTYSDPSYFPAVKTPSPRIYAPGMCVGLHEVVLSFMFCENRLSDFGDPGAKIAFPPLFGSCRR